MSRLEDRRECRVGHHSHRGRQGLIRRPLHVQQVRHVRSELFQMRRVPGEDVRVLDLADLQCGLPKGCRTCRGLGAREWRVASLCWVVSLLMYEPIARMCEELAAPIRAWFVSELVQRFIW